MTRKEIEQPYKKICSNLATGRIKEALDELETFMRRISGNDLFYELETVRENYRTLLKYAYEGYHDPQQESILQGLGASVLHLADEVRQLIMEAELPNRRSEKMTILLRFGQDPVSVSAKIEELYFNREVANLIVGSDIPGHDSETPGPIPMAAMEGIFKTIWLNSKLVSPLSDLLRRIVQSERTMMHEKCLMVSAVTVSLLTRFDHEKFLFLADCIALKENQVYQRALTGLVLGLIVYDARIRFYPELMTRLTSLMADDQYREEAELVLMQFLMARETEKITREFEEEVLPDMKKMMPRIEDKLNLGTEADEEDPEGRNPGWKDIIEEVPGLFEKIEKFTKMQIEGGDVFMSTFRMLKRFDFFNTMSNWFVPFYRQHPELTQLIPESAELNDRLLTSLEKAFYLCNSDKYSFSINFKAIPEQQRTMIVANFEAELAQMSEMVSEEQLLDQSLANNAIYIQYIQDLYRFYKLYPYHQEFDDIFQHRIRFRELTFYHEFPGRNSFLEKLAAFFLDNEHFYDAVEIFETLLERNEPTGAYFEKIGYCHQKTGRFRKAIEFYRKAELFDTDRLWLLKKLGWCSLKLKEYLPALEYFREAAAITPDDLGLQLQVGQCYLNLKRYDEALPHYAKLRFFAPENLKVLRPLAYCHFVLGNPDAAMEHYAVILGLTSEPTAYDLMNAANVKLCLGLRSEALALYRQAFYQHEPGKEGLLEAFDEDTPYLMLNGLKPAEIPLVRDHLLFMAES